MLAALLPTACPACGTRGPAPCETCWRALRPAPPAPPPDGVDLCRSLLLYDGAGRELVARLKYRNARSVVPWLASGMADLVARHVDADAVVTWAPTSDTRRRARGFDHAEILARAVARHLGLRCAPRLRRVSQLPQTGRPASERAAGVEFAIRPSRACERAVLLVDDVVTTGATLGAASHALRNGRATLVIAVTAARTPLKLAK
jgi:ComF family protein